MASFGELVLDSLPVFILIPMLVFPYVLRLLALAHLGANSDLTAADRNDHAVAFSLPIVGLGAAIDYCFKWLHGVAALGLVWLVLAGAAITHFVLK